MKNKRNKRAGFTLTELVIVIVIIAILASIMYPIFQGYIMKSKKIKDIALIKVLNDNTKITSSILEEEINLEDIKDYETYDILLFNQETQSFYLYNQNDHIIYNEDNDIIQIDNNSDYTHYYYFDDNITLDKFTLYGDKEETKEEEKDKNNYYVIDSSGNTNIYYESLEDALLSEYDTIYLNCDDMIIDKAISINKSITLDLNGHTLTLKSILSINCDVSTDNVIIRNNSNNSSIININDDNYIENNKGVLTINNMIIKGYIINRGCCYIEHSDINKIILDSNSFSKYYTITDSHINERAYTNKDKFYINSGTFGFDPTHYLQNGSSITDTDNETYWIVEQ